MRKFILGARRYLWLVGLSLVLVTIVAVRTASLRRQGATLKAWHSLGQSNIDLFHKSRECVISTEVRHERSGEILRNYSKRFLHYARLSSHSGRNDTLF